MSRSPLLILFCCLQARAGSPSPLLLNEVLYDPPGSDAGGEFVELIHRGSEQLSLAGFELQFVNGSDPSSPRSLWRGSASQLLSAGARWVIGEGAVAARNETASLELQNGPDAIWLLRDGVRVDALAWGDVEGLGEGRPARDVSNLSLARVPDGIDTDDNLLDWLGVDPTPGAANSFEHRLRPTTLRIEPRWRATAGPLRATLQLLAVGDAPLQHAAVQWRLDDAQLRSQDLVAAHGDSLRLELGLQATPGPHRLVVQVRSQSDVLDSLALAFRIGAGAARLSELMPRPESGQAEWIELEVLAPEFCAGAGYAVFDASDVPHDWDAEAVPCASRFVLLASDCARLQSQQDIAADVPCFPLSGGWLTLNDRGSDDAPADVVGLSDPSAAVIDWVAYGQGLEIPRGRSLERAQGGAEAGWLISPAAPTPGRPNAIATAQLPRQGLRVDPNPYRPGGSLLHVVLRAQPQWGQGQAEIRDLRGRLVRRLSGTDAGALRQWVWDGLDQAGRAVDPGAYVVWVDVADANGGPKRWQELLAVGVAR